MQRHSLHVHFPLLFYKTGRLLVQRTSWHLNSLLARKGRLLPQHSLHLNSLVLYSPLLKSQFVKNWIHFFSPLVVVKLQHSLRQCYSCACHNSTNKALPQRLCRYNFVIIMLHRFDYILPDFATSSIGAKYTSSLRPLRTNPS